MTSAPRVAARVSATAVACMGIGLFLSCAGPQDRTTDDSLPEQELPGTESVAEVAPNENSTWNFDADQTGAIAASFTNEVGEWKVVADATAPSPPNVLAQLARSSGPTFNVTLVDGTTYRDVDIAVDMRSVAGRVDQGGGLVWRAKDAKNYYIARYNPLEENLRVYHVVNGRRSQLRSVTIKRSEGWHTLRVTMTGDSIACYYDGKKYLEVKDAAFQEAGRIGLWSKADAQTHFDNLRASGM